MKRPMVIIVAAVLSGILYGLPGIPGVYRISVLSIVLCALIRFVIRYRGRNRLPLYFILSIVLLFGITAYLRSVSVTKQYERYSSFYEKFEATNPGEFDYALYLKSMQVTNEEERKALKERNSSLETPVQTMLRDVRDDFSFIIDQRMTEHDAGIVKAMLFGDKTGMEEDVKSLYQEAGIAHLLAVSGLHVSLIGITLFSLMKNKMKAGLAASAIISSIITFIYAFFTGGQASSIRASIMYVLGLAALLIGRKKDLLSSLCVAAVVLLFKSPYLITQSGFLLSFTAIFGIVLNGKDRNALNSSLMVTLATLPIVASSYFQVPLYSVLLNLLVIPLMAVVFVSGTFVLLFGLFSGFVSMIPLISGILDMFSVISAAPAHYILKAYELFGSLSLKLPAAKAVIGKPAAWKILIFYVFLYVISRFVNKEKLKTVKPVLLYGFFLISVLTLRMRDNNSCYVTVLDVGQGDSFHIHDGDTDIIIDCGSSGYESAGSRIMENYLLSKAITEIDAVLVSHADSDHTNGVLYLLSDESSIKISSLYLPYLAKKDEKYEKLIEEAKEIKTGYAKEGTVIKGNHINLKCIYSEENTEAMKDTNRESAVWLLNAESFSMLFCGDITEQEESLIINNEKREKLLENLKVLKCSHHGSNTANSERFLETLNPDVCVLSYGANNRYGHPSGEVTERIKDLGAEKLSTAENGSIVFDISRKGYNYSTWK